MAREIHDTLAQGFTSIVMHLEAAEQNLSNGAEASRRHLHQARSTARDSLAEARRLVWALRPPALEQDSLAEALGRLAARWSEESGVAASTTITGTPRPLAPEVEVTLLRIAQESLANIRKHAQASSVTITLSFLDDDLILDVQDNGIGFNPAYLPTNQRQNGGYGLLAMRERVAQLGGTLLVESEPGEETTVVVELPTA